MNWIHQNITSKGKAGDTLYFRQNPVSLRLKPIYSYWRHEESQMYISFVYKKWGIAYIFANFYSNKSKNSTCWGLFSTADYDTLGAPLFTAAGWCIWDWLKIIYSTHVHCNKGTRHPGQPCDWCGFNRFWTKNRALWQRQISFSISRHLLVDFCLLIGFVDSQK